MKKMLDTNVLISALVFGGRTGRLLNMLFESDISVFVKVRQKGRVNYRTEKIFQC